MADAGHHLCTTDENVVHVGAPSAGNVLVANASGRWQPLALGVVAGSFGTAQTLTAALTALTTVAPSTPDYAIADVTNVSPYGFADAEEARTVLSVIANLQLRLAEVETKLIALGICEAAS